MNRRWVIGEVNFRVRSGVKKRSRVHGRA